MSTPSGTRRSEILATAAELFASSGLRTSVNEVAKACGILPGSLYHHFESKEAIIVELVRAYRDDLDGVAEESLVDSGLDVEERVVAMALAIADCAVRHRAALLLTYYEAPSVAGDEVVELGRVTITAIEKAMQEILGDGQAQGVIRGDVDLAMLASRICHSMLHTGLGFFHTSRGAERWPEAKCRVLLHGIAVRPPKDRELDRSPALRAARAVVGTWDAPATDEGPRESLIAVARSEFGRRGFEATTIRDIAAAAGVSIGMVYRLVGSKDELLTSIMGAYVGHVQEAWSAVLGSTATALEKLDALMFVDVNVVHRFSDEFTIQLAWLRQSPPSTVELGRGLGGQIKAIKALLAEVADAGDLALTGASADIRARAVIDLLWVPEHIVQSLGVADAHTLARQTVLSGAAVRA